MAHLPAHLFIRRQDRRSVLSAGLVCANSQFSSRWAGRVYGINARVLYQGVDTDFFKPTEIPRKNFVLSVGRLDETKGHDFLLDALALVPAAIRPQLFIVCDAIDESYKKGLENKASLKKISLQFHYRIKDEALRDLYRSCLAVLCAARHEPFGLTPLEAGACGKPVIAADEGGFRETVVDGKTGYLLPFDRQRWTRRIQELTENSSLCRRLGEAGRFEAESRWSWDSLIPEYEKCLKL